MPVQKYPYYLQSIFRLLNGVRPVSLVVRLFLKLSPPPFPEVELRPSGLRFTARSAMDVWCLKETFLDRVYERYGTPVGQGWTIIDIGGGLGDFSILAASAHPSNRVITFEPTPESFALLQQNVERNGIKNIEAYMLGIWSGETNLVLDTALGNPVQFSSRPAGSPMISNQAQKGESLLAQAISLPQAFERFQVKTCSLLKLDCEGAEFEILFNTPADLFQRIERIVMEYHDGVTPYNHNDMDRFLARQGYRVRVTSEFVHQNLGFIYAERP